MNKAGADWNSFYQCVKLMPLIIETFLGLVGNQEVKDGNLNIKMSKG